MALKKIKLVGFKSFVDPTVIQLNSRISAVVGPNGCGKSNVIDAVRWVMGESSAKQLRGDSMSDVIFNGSEKRKPVGLASIELLFDNSKAMFGGEYAKYSEIAIRREVSRDGYSDYYLGGVRCRRKDIVDLFLGTGLGPQSYAIISQGTISQFIDAKPDDLRMYLEEAAGISKYKERRRETENRIKHTRENLARLNDLRDEIEKQLKHLKSQANAAERYKKLKQDERLTKAQLHALHCLNLKERLADLEGALQKEEVVLEQKISGQHVCDAKIDESKEKHIGYTDNFNEVQSQYYKIGADIARIEQQIHYCKERRQQLTGELEQIEKNYQETLAHTETDEAKLTLLREENNNLTHAIVNLQLQAEEAERELSEKETKMQLLQGRWEEANAAAAKLAQRIEVAETKSAHATQTMDREQQLLTKLHDELNGIAFSDLEAEIAELARQEGEFQLRSEELNDNLVARQRQIGDQRTINEQLNSDLAAIRDKLQTCKGRLAALEALQQAALGKNEAGVTQWLQRSGLSDNKRLLAEIKVAEGWDRAVETVLDNHLEAIYVDNLESVFNLLQELPHGQLMFFSNCSSQNMPITPLKAEWETLASKINSDLSIINQLTHIYAVENLASAQQLLPTLAPHESVITRDGIWLSPSWLRVGIEVENKFGIIQREKELRALQAEINDEQENLAQKEHELQRQQEVLSDLEQQHFELQKAWQENSTLFAKLHGESNAKQKNFDYLKERERTLNQEIANHEFALAEQQQQLVSVQEDLQQALLEQEQCKEQTALLFDERSIHQEETNIARDTAVATRKEFESAQMRIEMSTQQIGYLQQNLERSQKQLADLTEQKAQNAQLLEEAVTPLAALESELASVLTQRLQTEHSMHEAKCHVVETENLLRELEQKREALQEEARLKRDALEKIRMDVREVQIRAATHEEQITELDYSLQALIQDLESPQPEEQSAPTIAGHEEKLNSITNRIDRLGPINLAAISEFEEQTERKEYLDTQNQDLLTALETLENAMRKIDHDTKSRFHETFDKVNGQFQHLFTKIFGGGKASLELVGDDLLNTGVAILAQPPGKRNSSIHLLSGGEKALTTIALIFSIFQLNPAPFCMLDEVDAPLDDTNVIRFCNLMKEMASSIQLIFISHNKLTLEIADQLTGVTMQEAGVSRIVSVNIEAALEMAKQDEVAK
jgi:chromosome segregation protein